MPAICLGITLQCQKDHHCSIVFGPWLCSVGQHSGHFLGEIHYQCQRSWLVLVVYISKPSHEHSWMDNWCQSGWWFSSSSLGYHFLSVHCHPRVHDSWFALFRAHRECHAWWDGVEESHLRNGDNTSKDPSNDGIRELAKCESLGHKASLTLVTFFYCSSWGHIVTHFLPRLDVWSFIQCVRLYWC
jgi:hypothetical protein